MSLDIYDGNNVMRRAFEQRGQLAGQRPMSLRMRYEHAMAQPAGTQIWCWDGRAHNERRREIYPQYKMNRNPTPEDIFAQIRLWRDIAKHSPIIQFEVHGWEADDVIGTLVRRFAAKGYHCRVHTNDMDYGQIAHLCTLNGVNMKDVEPRWVPLYKALCGDSSDNIDGIPGFGPGRWKEMQSHWPAILQAIVTGTPEAFADLPFKPAVKRWLADQANVDLLQNMLLVTHFQEVPDDELDGGAHFGEPDRAAALELLEKYFL